MQIEPHEFYMWCDLLEMPALLTRALGVTVGSLFSCGNFLLMQKHPPSPHSGGKKEKTAKLPRVTVEGKVSGCSCFFGKDWSQFCPSLCWGLALQISVVLTSVSCGFDVLGCDSYVYDYI